MNTPNKHNPLGEKRGGGKGRDRSGKIWPELRRWKGRKIRRERKYPKPIPEFGKCRRCGVSFAPDWMEQLNKFANCCDRCKIKNLSDALAMPELRDYAKIPRHEK